jgi:hypothetical protein
MDLRHKSEIEGIVLDQFALLASEKGFTVGLQVHRDAGKSGGWFTDFLYRKPDLGIEVELDFYDKDIGVYIVPLENGIIPEKPFGSRIKWRLVDHIVNTLRVRDVLITAITTLDQETSYSKRDSDYARQKITLLGELVAKYVDRISPATL